MVMFSHYQSKGTPLESDNKMALESLHDIIQKVSSEKSNVKPSVSPKTKTKARK